VEMIRFGRGCKTPVSGSLTAAWAIG
jgi:hypothetical protein